MSEERERQAFEAWYRGTISERTAELFRERGMELMKRRESGGYFNPGLQLAWKAWRARAIVGDAPGRLGEF